jgi:hypothetical protein
MAIRDELVAARSGRYVAATRDEKTRILDEFAAVTGFHRKHAMRVLRSGRAARTGGPRPERRLKLWRAERAHEMVFASR